MEPPVIRQHITEHATQKAIAHATYNRQQNNPKYYILKTA
jgi:hypothetical protein